MTRWFANDIFFKIYRSVDFHFFILYLILYQFFIEVQQSAVNSTQPRVSLGYKLVIDVPHPDDSGSSWLKPAQLEPNAESQNTNWIFASAQAEQQ